LLSQNHSLLSCSSSLLIMPYAHRHARTHTPKTRLASERGKEWRRARPGSKRAGFCTADQRQHRLFPSVPSCPPTQTPPPRLFFRPAPRLPGVRAPPSLCVCAFVCVFASCARVLPLVPPTFTP
jgi:hypothetical protein